MATTIIFMFICFIIMCVVINMPIVSDESDIVSENDMTVKCRKVHSDAKIPRYATLGSSGFDFYTIEDVVLHKGQTVVLRTGLAFEIPMGFEMQIRPRSGISCKTKIRIANSPGSIDSDFRDEVGIIVERIDDSDFPVTIEKGTRIAQGVIGAVFKVEFEEAEELNTTEREGGFGSTGLK